MNNEYNVELDQVEDWEAEYNAFCDEQDWRNEAFHDINDDF